MVHDKTPPATCTSPPQIPNNGPDRRKGAGPTPRSTSAAARSKNRIKAGVQVKTAGVQVKAAGIQVEAAGVQVKTAGVQVKTAGIQVKYSWRAGAPPSLAEAETQATRQKMAVIVVQFIGGLDVVWVAVMRNSELRVYSWEAE